MLAHIQRTPATFITLKEAGSLLDLQAAFFMSPKGHLLWTH